MRNGQHQHHNKRMRGRNNNNNNSNNNNNNRRNHNPLTRVYESNGPDVKIRGTASHVAEKYLQLARDSQSSGDPVSAENYFQHAEHYFRLIAVAQEQFRQSNPNFQAPRPEGGGGNDQQFQPRPEEHFEDGDDDGQPFVEAPFGRSEPQPYIPPNAQPFVPRDNQNFQPRESQPHEARSQEIRPHETRPHEPRQHEPRQHEPRQHEPRQHEPRQHEPRQHEPRPPQPRVQAEPGNVDALPAFITGGAPQAAPAQANGPNGYDNQPDRFPLHRRRRRHRGPRGDIPGAPPQGDDRPDDSGAG